MSSQLDSSAFQSKRHPVRAPFFKPGVFAGPGRVYLFYKFGDLILKGRVHVPELCGLGARQVVRAIVVAKVRQVYGISSSMLCRFVYQVNRQSTPCLPLCDLTSSNQCGKDKSASVAIWGQDRLLISLLICRQSKYLEYQIYLLPWLGVMSKLAGGWRQLRVRLPTP